MRSSGPRTARSLGCEQGRAHDRRHQRVFGFSKVRYRGLEKNAQRLFVTCALTNLFMVRGHLLRRQGA